jgi:hypothetical protein
LLFAAISHEQDAGDHEQRNRQSGKQFTFRTPEHFEPPPQRQVIRGVQHRGDVGTVIANLAEVALESERAVDAAIAQQQRK